MRRTGLYLIGWFAAGVAAVTVAGLGVSMVTDQVTGSRPAPLSAQQVQEQLDAGPTTDGGTDTPSTDGTATDDTVTSTTSTTAPVATTPTTAGPSSTDGPGTTAATTPPPPPTTAAVTRSYDLVGGSVTLRFEPSGVTVLLATPKAGFSVDVGESHDSGARVEFESDGHKSRLDAWWDGGPQDEVREED